MRFISWYKLKKICFSLVSFLQSMVCHERNQEVPGEMENGSETNKRLGTSRAEED